MMAYRRKLVMKWKDVNNGTTTKTFHTADNPAPTLGTATGFVTAMQNASYGATIYVETVEVRTDSGTPATGPYQTVRDYAHLQFRCANANVITINIPAPRSGCFLADTKTFDPASTLGAAVVSAVLAGITDASGSPATTFISGKRLKANQIVQFGG